MNVYVGVCVCVCFVLLDVCRFVHLHTHTHTHTHACFVIIPSLSLSRSFTGQDETLAARMRREQDKALAQMEAPSEEVRVVGVCVRA
jgi:hypothetical protein